MVDYNNLTFHEKLGEGGQGSVNRVTFKKPYRGYTEAAGKSVHSSFRREEVDILSKLSHPNIVEWIGLYENGPVKILLTEYAKNGSLHTYLSNETNQLPNSLKLKWITEAALAIQYLHQRNCLHRDIKGNNCLLFQNNTLKLCDFGLAREIDQSETTSTGKGTYQYMPPEIHNTKGKKHATYTKSVDIYAFGMLVQEIWSRKPPFHDVPYGQVVYQVGEGKLQPTIPADCPLGLADLMKRCWNVNPRGRPTIDTIVHLVTRQKWVLEREFRPAYQGKPRQAFNVACCPNGDIVIGEFGRVHIIDRDGKWKMGLTTSEADKEKQIGRVHGIRISKDGYIVVLDDTMFVKVFANDGKYLCCLPVEGKIELSASVFGPRGIAIDREGLVLVGDNERGIIAMHSCPDGEVVKRINFRRNHNTFGMNICVNSNKEILYHSGYMAKKHSEVVAITYAGKEVYKFSPRIGDHETEGALMAGGIVCDAYDNIYLTTYHHHYLSLNSGHLHMYSPTGAFLQCIAKGLCNNCDLSISHDGSFLVVGNDQSILMYRLKI